MEEYRLPDNSRETEIVLAFRGASKRLPLNKTQATTLAHLLGDDAEQWKSKTLLLAPAIAPNRKPAIAVSAAAENPIPAQPGQPQPPAEPGPDAEENDSNPDAD